MSLYKRSIPKPPIGITEFEILKASHKFLRDEDDPLPERSLALNAEDTDPQNNTDSWNDQLAAKYYSSLYREFALCDLKHYKSGNFALRWRTEDEVLSGSGETTCGNTRCEHHHLPPTLKKKVPLTTLELPFGYIEHGKSKSALVKVVLCSRCLKKLMWKRNKEKGDLALVEDGDEDGREKVLREEGADRDQESSGKSKRKWKEEEEEEGVLQLREELVRRSSLIHDTPPINREPSDRLGKRRRSRSRSRSRTTRNNYTG